MATGQSGITNLGLRVRSALRVEESADRLTVYIGEAPPGSLTSEDVWTIKRVTFADLAISNVIIEWADGDTKGDNVWDDRLTLSYS